MVQADTFEVSPGYRKVLCVLPGITDPEECILDTVPSQVLPENTTMHELLEVFVGNTPDKCRIVFEPGGTKHCGNTSLREITSEKLIVLQGVECPLSGIRLQAQGESHPDLEDDIQRSLEILHDFNGILFVRNFTSKKR